MARYPDFIPRPLYRCSRGLAVGTATSNGGIAYEVIPVAGSAKLRVRIKTSGNGGTLDVFFLGPDFVYDAGAQDGSTAYASLVGTIYSTGNPTQLAVSAGTEAKVDVDLYGETYAILKFTGTVGAGAITYVDASQV